MQTFLEPAVRTHDREHSDLSRRASVQTICL